MMGVIWWWGYWWWWWWGEPFVLHCETWSCQSTAGQLPPQKSFTQVFLKETFEDFLSLFSSSFFGGRGGPFKKIFTILSVRVWPDYTHGLPHFSFGQLLVKDKKIISGDLWWSISSKQTPQEKKKRVLSPLPITYIILSSCCGCFEGFPLETQPARGWPVVFCLLQLARTAQHEITSHPKLQLTLHIDRCGSLLTEKVTTSVFLHSSKSRPASANTDSGKAIPSKSRISAFFGQRVEDSVGLKPKQPSGNFELAFSLSLLSLARVWLVTVALAFESGRAVAMTD